MTLDGRGERATTTLRRLVARTRLPRRSARCACRIRSACSTSSVTDAPRLPAFERRVQGDGAGRARPADATAPCCATSCTSAPTAATRIDAARSGRAVRAAARTRRAAAAAPLRHRRVAAGGAGGNGAEDRRLAAPGERRAPPRDGRRRGAQLRDERAPARQRHLRAGVGAAGCRRRGHRARRRAVGRCRGARGGVGGRARRDRALAHGARLPRAGLRRRCRSSSRCSGPSCRTAAMRRRRARRGDGASCCCRTASSAGSRAAWSSARARSARARSSPRRSIPRCRRA